MINRFALWRERRLSRAYKEVFAGKSGETVLADLARHCGAGTNPMTPGAPDATAYNLGLLEGFKRIRRYVEMSEADLREIQRRERNIEDGERNRDDEFADLNGA